MNWKKKIYLFVIASLIVIQFIQPAHNTSGQVLPSDITKTVIVPDKINGILTTACNDCHSNNTRYPWYVYIQPMGWIMENHIKTGKENLNFSEFGNYSKRKQANKLRSIGISIEDGSMPLYGYTIMHKGARLSTEEKKMIIAWASITKDSLSKN